MSYVDSIIERFGGLSATARALGHKHPTTVQGWVQRGLIPAKQIPKILAAAKAQKITIELHELIAGDAA